MRTHALLGCTLTLVACTSSTARTPVTFDSGLDTSRSVTSLSTSEVAAFCEVDRSLTEADRVSRIEQLCKSIAAFGADEASCLQIHHDCLAAEPDMVITCQSMRPAPADAGPVCASETVGEVERGLEAFLNTEIPESIETICALPTDARHQIGDLGRLGVSETDLGGYNCAVNSTLSVRVTVPSREVCFDVDVPLLGNRICL